MSVLVLLDFALVFKVINCYGSNFCIEWSVHMVPNLISQYVSSLNWQKLPLGMFYWQIWWVSKWYSKAYLSWSRRNKNIRRRKEESEGWEVFSLKIQEFISVFRFLRLWCYFPYLLFSLSCVCLIYCQINLLNIYIQNYDTHLFYFRIIGI